MKAKEICSSRIRMKSSYEINLFDFAAFERHKRLHELHRKKKRMFSPLPSSQDGSTFFRPTAVPKLRKNWNRSSSRKDQKHQPIILQSPCRKGSRSWDPFFFLGPPTDHVFLRQQTTRKTGTRKLLAGTKNVNSNDTKTASSIMWRFPQIHQLWSLYCISKGFRIPSTHFPLTSLVMQHSQSINFAVHHL